MPAQHAWVAAVPTCGKQMDDAARHAAGAATAGVGVVGLVQEKPAMSEHVQEPQLVLNRPHLASHFSVQSWPLHLSAHWFLASRQQNVFVFPLLEPSKVTVIARHMLNRANNGRINMAVLEISSCYH